MDLNRIRNLGPLLKPALLALIPIAIAGVLFSYFARGVIEDRAHAEARQQATVVARLAFAGRLPKGRHRLAPSRRRALDRAIARLDHTRGTTATTLWSRRLHPLYSSGHKARAAGSPDRARLQTALAGRSSAVHSGRRLEVYVPIRRRRGRAPSGALQVSFPYALIAAAVGSDTRKLDVFLAVTLLLLYAAILAVAAPSLRRVVRQLTTGQESADLDALTGLPNRTVFHRLVEKAILVNRRKRSLVAVVFMDLDRFKEINDTLGHFNGDQLLKRLSARVRSLLRDADTIARMGGDEFAILMPDMPDRAAVAAAAERVRQAFEEPFVVGGIALQVQGSIGIALCPEHGKRAEPIIQAADAAMYVAKAARSGFEFYSPVQSENSPDRLALIADLRRAVEANQLVLHYQPKAELPTRRVTGVEALVRWEHPTRGMLFPDEFISLAEQTGLIRSLTEHVLETSLRQCRTWRDDGLELDVAVNLSVHNLMDRQFADNLARLLEESSLPPEVLELEITESMIMSDPSRAMSVLNRIRSMGVKLAVDDYGTGYSSLAYLSQLPVGTIKIDKSFVMPMMEDAQQAMIVRSTIDLGRNLGLQVVAEGVESEGAWLELAQHGCDIAQGYHLSRPLPSVKLTDWLRAYVELVPSDPGAAVGGVVAS